MLAGWIMELIKVEEQFFAGFGFSISGDAWEWAMITVTGGYCH